MSTGEFMTQTRVETLGVLGTGNIGPGPRIESGEIAPETVDEVNRRLATDEFYRPVSDELRPNAPGGTFCLAVADALTTQRYYSEGEDARQHATRLFSALLEMNDVDDLKRIIPAACMDGRHAATHTPSLVGGHDGDHGLDDCGAQKRLTEILGFITCRGDEIRSFLGGIGVAVDDETHELIVRRSKELIDTGYAVDGLSIRKAYEATAGQESVVHLQFAHGEVAAELNLDPSVTLDREKLDEAYGHAINAFNVDAGVFPKAAEVISLTSREAEQKAIAMLYYTVGTSAILGHSSLPVNIHQ